jgi:catechol 2,3-dioxygenase-like lactoylglutathione lyase family enzyme
MRPDTTPDQAQPPAAVASAELFHVGLTVEDLDASLRFYVDVVGMEVMERIHRRSRNFDELMSNLTGTEVKVAYLTAGAFCLQLIEYVRGGGDTLPLAHNKVGNPHLCFYVPDVRATFRDVQQRGDVPITSDVVQVAPTMLSFYVSDPNGVPVEFLERTAPVADWTGSVDIDD